MNPNEPSLDPSDLEKMLGAKEKQFRVPLDREVLTFLLTNWFKLNSVDLHLIFLSNELKKDHPKEWKKMIEISFFKV